MAKTESGKTYADILQQIEALKAEGNKLREKEVADVVAKIKEAIQIYSLTAADLGIHVSTGPRAFKPALVVKYRDKASGNTWSGRGKKPRWLTAAILAGKGLEEFLV